MKLKEFVKTLNARECAAFKNFYHAANWNIGEMENAVNDGVEGDWEEILNDHDYLVNLVYTEGLSSIYVCGGCFFNEGAKSRIKYFKFCGKKRLMELADIAVKYAGW